MTKRVLCVAGILLLPPLVVAQPADPDSRSETRLLRQDARAELVEPSVAKILAEDRTVWQLALGVAATDGEHGASRWRWPFSIRANLRDGVTALKLSGDGYAVEDSNGDTLSGMSDLNAAVLRRLYTGGEAKLQAEAGVTLPAGGDIGGSRGKQRIGASYKAPLTASSWSGTVTAKLTRTDEDPPPNVSRVTRSGLVQVSREQEGVTSAFKLLRSYRPGRRGTSEAAFTYQWPLAPGKASLGVAQGIASGSKDTTLEFELSWQL